MSGHTTSGSSADIEAPTVEMLEVDKTAEGYTLSAIVRGASVVTATVGRLRWDDDDLRGELRMFDEERELLTTEWTLTKPASRRDVLALLGKDSHWREILNTLARDVIAARRMGTHTPVRLHEVARPDIDQFYNLGVLPPVLRRHINIWFADGGTGKSYLALCAAGELARQGVRALYLDWELDAGEHRTRLEQLYGASEMPDVLYWHCEVSLPQLTETLRTVIAKHNVEFLIVDSIGYAVNGGPEISSTANEYTQAVRSLGVGSLHLAHTTKGRARKKGDKGVSRYPFGSIFWHNGCRMSWNLVRGEDSDPNSTVVAAHQRKLNTAASQPSRYLKLMLANETDGSVTVTPLDAKGHSGSSTGPQTVAERIHEALATKSLTRRELKAALSDVSPKTVDTTVRRELKAQRIHEADGYVSIEPTG